MKVDVYQLKTLVDAQELVDRLTCKGTVASDWRCTTHRNFGLPTALIEDGYCSLVAKEEKELHAALIAVLDVFSLDLSALRRD